MSPEPKSHGPKVCAVCMRVLDRFEYKDGHEQWAHGHQVLRNNEDHLPIPIDPTEDNVSSVCDFCYETLVKDEWTVVCKPFITPPLPGPRNEWTSMSYSALWAACNTCKPMIEHRRWQALLEHVLTTVEKRDPSPDFITKMTRQTLLGALYDQVAANYVTVRPSRPRDLIEDDDFALSPFKKDKT